jgi:hypothetical protein
MKISRLIVAAVFAVGLGGAASAMPNAPDPAELVQQPGTTLEYAKGPKGWKAPKGRHFSAYRDHHRGWYRPQRRVYYAPPRRHYGWRQGHHYGQYRRPARGVYFRF